jgi:hypothetical protein
MDLGVAFTISDPTRTAFSDLGATKVGKVMVTSIACLIAWCNSADGTTCWECDAPVGCELSQRVAQQYACWPHGLWIPHPAICRCAHIGPLVQVPRRPTCCYAISCLGWLFASTTTSLGLVSEVILAQPNFCRPSPITASMPVENCAMTVIPMMIANDGCAASRTCWTHSAETTDRWSDC